MPALGESVHYKQFIKMTNEKLKNTKVLQHLFKEYANNISTFTGSLEPDVVRKVKYDH